MVYTEQYVSYLLYYILSLHKPPEKNTFTSAAVVLVQYSRLPAIKCLCSARLKESLFRASV